MVSCNNRIQTNTNCSFVLVVPSIHTFSEKFDEVHLIEIQVDEIEEEEESYSRDKFIEDEVEYLENEEVEYIDEEPEEQTEELPVKEPDSNLKQELNRAKDEISLLKQQIFNLQHSLIDKSQQMDSILAKVQELDNKIDHKATESGSCEQTEIEELSLLETETETEIVYEEEYLEDQQSIREESNDQAEECYDYLPVDEIEEMEDDTSVIDCKNYIEVEVLF